jgi:hypothetical protein
MTGYCPAGLPHSEIPGSKPVCGSPRLIAAYRVLRRLSAPRHPPCTLSSLTKLEHSFPGESYRFLPDSVVNELKLWILGSMLPWCDLTLPITHDGTMQPRAYQRFFTKNFGLAYLPRPGGADRVRTDDLRLARAALSQLSYSPFQRGPLTRAPGKTREWWA